MQQLAIKTALLSLILALAACEQPNADADGIVQSEAVKEPRGAGKAVPYDIDRRPSDPMNQYHDYQNRSPDSGREHWIILSNSLEARKSREIFENELNNGNYMFQNKLISQYISLSDDKKIPKKTRRKYLIDALWLWQRLPPHLERWEMTSDKFPEKLSDDLDSQKRIQDLIYRLHALESE